MKHIVSFGGGASSVLLVKHLVETHGAATVRPVMAVLPNEHPDVWRVCDRVEELYNVTFTYIAYNPDTPRKWWFIPKADRTSLDCLHTPIDVFFRQRFLGNSRIDPCSRLLKRETITRFMLAVWPTSPLYVGIGPNEWDRMSTIKPRWAALGINCYAPLIDDLSVGDDMSTQHRVSELLGFMPELYALGFRHNNCGGACIKAGQREWARLLYYLPDVYAEWELAENIFRARHGDYSILRDRRNGATQPLPLYTFRRWMEREFAGYLPGTAPLMVFNRLPTTPACVTCTAA